MKAEGGSVTPTCPPALSPGCRAAGAPASAPWVGCSPGPASTSKERGRGVVPSKRGECPPLLMGGSDIFKVTMRTYYSI